MSVHGGCHVGLSCRTMSRRTSDVEGVLRCIVGPFAFGGIAPAPSRRSVSADEVMGRPLVSVVPAPAGVASINLFNLASPA